ncbi:hypothetical protein HMPREF9946_01058 [Acetobacteraceae bacterium AT-5844]|nr:hypothetical protein HMPREF9946_01058 [Acetobacteraceae bacterium AT-5844]
MGLGPGLIQLSLDIPAIRQADHASPRLHSVAYMAMRMMALTTSRISTMRERVEMGGMAAPVSSRVPKPGP